MVATRAEKIAALKTQLATVRQRVDILEQQIGAYGTIAAPVHKILERNQALADIADLEAEITRLRNHPISENNPYLGLLSFKEADAERFFGRDALIAELVTRAEKTAFLAVLGASGSGKSSVVRAGLVPALKAGRLHGSEHWRSILMRPGARPVDTLAAELAKLQAGDLDQTLHLTASLSKHTNALFLAAELLLDRTRGQRLILIVDQAEELWTNASAKERTQFIELLLTASASSESSVITIVTMRADFLHRVAEHPALAKAIADNDVIVSLMSERELRDAIVQPADQAGAHFQNESLVDELVKQSLNRQGALPLLEYTLQALWEKQDNGQLTWDAYRSLGGVEGALAARADQIIAKHYPEPAQKNRLRAILLRLVQPGEGVEDTRRVVDLTSLTSNESEPTQLKNFIAPFVQERFLTTNTDHNTGHETLEIAHEALIRAWPIFKGWIDANRADLRFHLQLDEAAKEWIRNQEDPDFLWAGLRLDNVEEWLTQAHLDLTETVSRFLAACRSAQQKRKTDEQMMREREIAQERELSNERATKARQLSRRAQFLTGALFLALCAIGVAIYFIYRTDAQLRISESQRLGSLAQSFATTNPELGILLSIEAGARADTNVSQQAIQSNLGQMQAPPLQFGGHTGPIYQAAWSPDSMRIVTASADKTAKVWSVDGTPQATLQGHTGTVNQASWSPDGTRILTASNDKTARVWAADGILQATLQGHSGAVNQASWSPDGTHILTVSADGVAKIWSTNGTLQTTIDDDINGVTQAAWSPDSMRIVTASAIREAKVWAVDGRLLTTLHGDGNVTQASWSLDGSQIVTASGDKTAKVWTNEGVLKIILKSHNDGLLQASWSPDGTHILVVTASFYNIAKVWAADGTSQVDLQRDVSIIKQAAWSPNGSRIVAATDDLTAKVWSVDGTLQATLQGHSGTINQASWSPDGRSILTTSDDQTAKVWTADGTLQATLGGHTGSINQASWSPDGRSILTTSDDQTAKVWTADGALQAKLEGHQSYITEATWSPDGSRILTTSDDHTAKIWANNGALQTTLRGHRDTVSVGTWSPDGTRIFTASTDGIAKLWDVNGTLQNTFQGYTGYINQVVWSPDSRHILFVSANGVVGTWTVDSTLQTTFQGHSDRVYLAAWSPDSTRIATASADGTV